MNPADTFGEMFQITIIGESHGRCVGAVMCGLPAGIKINLNQINNEMRRRRPGQAEITTSRNEEDVIEILTGIFEGKTTGAPLTMVTWNKDIDSSKYEEFKNIPRPGHADYTAMLRYGGNHDFRGSGRFSGRLTAGIVMAGAIARQVLEKNNQGITISAHVREIGGIRFSGDVDPVKVGELVASNAVPCVDAGLAKQMEALILKTKEDGDSIGGIVECILHSIPPGLGDPIFANVESRLAAILFSIGGVKGVEFGAGFKVAVLKGSENNDPLRFDGDKNISFKTNNAGGILGGITTGQDIVFRVAIKPTSSISKKQDTVDLIAKKNIILEYKGRHDPCIVPRVVPVIEAAGYIVFLDMLTTAGLIPRVYRE